MWIEPEGFEAVHARGNTEAHRLQRPDKWTPYGVGAIEGKTRSLPVISSGAEERPLDGEPTATANHELL
jgi:hypothetical protein